MSHKMPLKQPIFNAIIHYAYMLHDDEREVLLRAFLEMSYQIHREAVDIMSPEEDIGSLIATHTQFEESQEIASPPVAATTPAPREAAAAARKAEKVSVNHESVITKHLRPFRQIFRRRESILQEEEELALFSTIQGVADQVNREAMEREIIDELKGDTNARFVAVYERASLGLEVPIVVSKGEKRAVVIAGGSKRVRRSGWPFDTYIELMDEELLITREIIEKNRIVSESSHKARAM